MPRKKPVHQLVAQDNPPLLLTLLGVLALSGGVAVATYFLLRANKAPNKKSPNVLPFAKDVIAQYPGERMPCCVFTARTLHQIWGNNVQGMEVGGDLWAKLNIWDRARPWSPIEATRTINEGIPFFPQAGDFEPGNWYLCQSWRRLSGPNNTIGSGDFGHAWFWYAISPTEGVVLDSDENRGPRLAGSTFTQSSSLPSTGMLWQDRLSSYPAGIACSLVKLEP